MVRKSLPREPKSGSTKKRKRKLPAGVVEKKGQWYVRVRYREAGKRHAVWRQCAKNAIDAKDVRKKLERKLEEHGPPAFLHSRQTWGALTKYYEDNYLVPAVYIDARKVAGRRNLRNPNSQLKRLSTLIGESTRLRYVDFGFIRRVRLDLIGTPTRLGGQRSMVDINRHMQLLRHMLKVARKVLGWIQHDPFADALEPLITPADERKRRRLMSFEEEEALLRQCLDVWRKVKRKDGRRAKVLQRRAHLRIVIIGLVDTLMRPGEFFKLRGRDANFSSQQITVEQMNTKTLSERAAPISSRFARELNQWFGDHHIGQDSRVFWFNDVKRAWASAKRDAGVRDLRLRDLRRTGATRLLRRGMPMEEISRILGHTKVAMTYEYVGIDRETTSRAVELLDAMHAEREQLDLIH